MTPEQVYLDYSATTPVAPQVLRTVQLYLAEQFANPSSPHRLGIEVEGVIKRCRHFIAQSLGASAKELIFTSGGTEANNLALQGVAKSIRGQGHLITSVIEHPSVLGVAEFLEEIGWEVTYLPVDQNGQVDPTNLQAAIKDNTRLVSIMYVNNETGAIQPIQEIQAIIARHNQDRQHRIYFHVDAIQALGNIPLRLCGDLISFSGHKIYAPKGIGLLYCNKTIPLKPLFYGGGQQNGIRPGTENVAGIVGFTKAWQLAWEHIDQNNATLQAHRGFLREKLREIPGSFINGNLELSSPHILNVGFTGVPSEVLVHYLEQREVYVGMGAACASKKTQVSHVLTAIGCDERQARSSIRISLSPYISHEELAYAAKVIAEAVNEVRAIYR